MLVGGLNAPRQPTHQPTNPPTHQPTNPQGALGDLHASLSSQCAFSAASLSTLKFDAPSASLRASLRFMRWSCKRVPRASIRASCPGAPALPFHFPCGNAWFYLHFARVPARASLASRMCLVTAGPHCFFIFLFVKLLFRACWGWLEQFMRLAGLLGKLLGSMHSLKQPLKQPTAQPTNPQGAWPGCARWPLPFPY